MPILWTSMAQVFYNYLSSHVYVGAEWSSIIFMKLKKTEFWKPSYFFQVSDSILYLNLQHEWNSEFRAPPPTAVPHMQCESRAIMRFNTKFGLYLIQAFANTEVESENNNFNKILTLPFIPSNFTYIMNECRNVYFKCRTIV
jgi:hypothetical protein